jgi:ABC-type lipoprotein release transport system permease subunit
MTGRAFLVYRLALADVRRHPIEAALLVLAITAATATLTLGLALHGVTNSPYQRTRAATAGPDIVAGLLNLTSVPSGARLGPAPRHQTIFSNTLQPNKRRTQALTALAHAAGVIAHSGPYPVAWATLRARGLTAGVAAEGRDRMTARVDQPLLTRGSWVASGEAVIEQSYAEALAVHVGDRVTLDGRPFRVSGLAVTTAAPQYPDSKFALGGGPFPDPGLIWVTRADARRLATRALPLSYVLDLRLEDPAKATAFVNARRNLPLSLISSQTIQQKDGKLVAVEQRALTVGGWLLGLLAVASVAVLVGGRMAEQARRVGLLKAVGAAPTLVAAVLLLEDLVLALVAAAAGLAIGLLAAPLLTNPGAGLIGSAGAPSLTASTVELVVAVALAVAIVATLIPALRASRSSTIRALANAARTPRRRSKLIALSTRLPIPVLFGVRLAARRPQRAILAAISIAITMTTLVAVLAVHTDQSGMLAGFSAIDNPRHDRVNHALLALSIVLILLAAINALFITWSTAIDARHQLTIARALGATPNQVAAGLSAAQIIPAIPGALLGIPAGIALVSALNHGDTITIPAAWSLIAVFLGTLLAVAALSTIPAHISARRPVTEILQAELA